VYVDAYWYSAGALIGAGSAANSNAVAAKPIPTHRAE
jgi:hypothetical protein